MYVRILLIVLAVFVGTVRADGKSGSVESLAQRVTLGTAKGNIVFRLQPNDGDKDFFDIEASDGKVQITGNSELSLSTGLNWYLKYVAGVHLTWNNLSQALPQPLPLPAERIHQETAMKDRYYLNYCTFSYSMAFWDWKRWEQELDWMALHGINRVLNLTGMETVWRNLLMRVGYSSDEVNQFIAGPAYMAWWNMNNLEGWGGPNPERWYSQREKLQKKIVARMRQLGIEPVFPGYAGMVPRNIGQKLGFQISDPGKWCGFPRPAFLSPEDEHFQSFAAMYYEELEKLYGKARYYAMDPFHEGGSSKGVDLAKAGLALRDAMKKANPEAVWVIQAWQANPREKMISPLPAGDMLVLDLYSDKLPQWGDKDSDWCRTNGFGQHRWLYCMLLNFGGNVGLHGRMNQLIDGYYRACAHPNGKALGGVGATPEGIENNPVMFELVYELPWRAKHFCADGWLQGYLKARYGGETVPEVAEAWRALEHTVYNAPVKYPGEGTVESLLCARPGLHLQRTSTWGCSQLFYSPDSTAKAARLLLSVAERYRGNNNYEYDLVDIVRQSLADRGNTLLQSVSQCYDRKDSEGFRRQSQRFLQLILLQDELLSTRKEFSVSTWLNAAHSLGKTETEKALYEKNASMLITVWGDSIAANEGGLHDYSHREWSGLLKDLYYPRWEAFFAQKQRELDGIEAQAEDVDFYGMEKAWAEKRKAMPTTVKHPSVIETAKRVFMAAFE